MERKSLQEVYDQHAEAMAAKLDAVVAMEEGVERFIALIGKEQPVIWEVGCGSGRDAEVVCRHTPNYVGIDISEGMLRHARLRLPEATFLQAVLETVEFPQGIDGILAIASLLHSPREVVEGFLKRAEAVLATGGIVYICLKEGKYQPFIKEDQFGSRLFYFYQPEDVISLAGQGYEVAFLEHSVRKEDLQPWFSIALRKK